MKPIEIYSDKKIKVIRLCKREYKIVARKRKISLESKYLGVEKILRISFLELGCFPMISFDKKQKYWTLNVKI